ncbi:MAG: polymer-forming cytoskeletal protein [Candidatus Promineofilum sp.]|nr:polymer-forming cytoskeletal protein [Promineifilum sp.]
MKRSVLIPLALALLLIVALTPVAFAGPLGPYDDTIIEANETVNNDVIVLDGDLTIREGAVVNGDVVVFNGDANVFGRVNGSVTLFNGDLETGETALVDGECVLLNGEVRGPVSLRNCTAVGELELPPLVMPEIQGIPVMPTMPAFEVEPVMPVDPVDPVRPVEPVMPVAPYRANDGIGFFGRLASAIASTVLFTLLGLFVGAVMPNQLRQIVGVARAKPVVSGLAGVLTAVAVPSLIVLLIPLSVILTIVCIGLLGFPIMLLLALGLVLGSLLGWVVVGTWLGVRLFGHGKDDHIVRAAALGTGALTLIFGVLGLIPFVFGESLLAFVVVSIGLGAVALTQFGLKPYPRLPRAAQPPTPNDGPDAGKVDIVLGTLPPEERPA